MLSKILFFPKKITIRLVSEYCYISQLFTKYACQLLQEVRMTFQSAVARLVLKLK